MIDLRVLIQGYAKREGSDWEAYPATIYIQDGAKKIIVDPGNHPGLTDLLEMNSIWSEEIDHVFITHTHLDHVMNIGLFPDADLIDGEFIYRGTRLVKHERRIPGTGIAIIPTPGHTPDHSSLLMNLRDRNIVVSGDLFWWEEGSERRYDHSSLLLLDDPICTDRYKLISSRRRILREADEIIPGHGERFIIQHDQ
jgi:glyoxylase-like metal-dependent hydrolase (beta-lactamase superfamily II)